MDPPDSASRVFCSRILSMVNVDDVNAIILAQKNMLDRFEKTNEMLLNFNNLSSARLQQMSERFLHHTRTLVEMKRDLDSIFRRIRTSLKRKMRLPGFAGPSQAGFHEDRERRCPSPQPHRMLDTAPRAPITTTAVNNCCWGAEAWNKLALQLYFWLTVPLLLFRGQPHLLAEQVPQIEGNMFPWSMLCAEITRQAG
nr:kxDL motif-containing protein 1 isoform X1 [Globicephala melas]XP_030735940.1 kxDL motif-containing protein 1 isoform X1 [Globicephala melas]